MRSSLLNSSSTRRLSKTTNSWLESPTRKRNPQPKPSKNSRKWLPTLREFEALSFIPEGIEDIVAIPALGPGLSDIQAAEQVEIQIKYAGYIEKEKNQADKLNRLENVSIPSNFDYSKVKSLSIEARQKLTKIKPITISQASRISGVSPSDVSVLLVYMGR